MAGRSFGAGGWPKARTCSCPVHSCKRAKIADNLTCRASPPPQPVSGGGTCTGECSSAEQCGQAGVLAGVTALPRPTHESALCACSLESCAARSPTHSCWLPISPGLQHTIGRLRLEFWRAQPRQAAAASRACKSMLQQAQPAAARRWAIHGTWRRVSSAADATARCHPAPRCPHTVRLPLLSL